MGEGEKKREDFRRLGGKKEGGLFESGHTP